MDRLTVEQFNALDSSGKAYAITAGIAPEGGAQQPSAPDLDQSQAPAQSATSAGTPDLDSIPEQTGKGPAFLPYDKEFDIEVTLDQVKHRSPPGKKPNFYASMTITKADESATAAGFGAGVRCAFGWFYDPHARYEKEQKQSEWKLREYRDFVRRVSGLSDGSSVNTSSANLLSRSEAMPSLGIKLRIVQIRGNEKRQKPGQFYYDMTIIRL